MADDPLCASGPPDLNKHLMCLPVLRSRNSWRENSAASRHRQSFASKLLYHCISRGSTRLIRKERAQGHLRETNEFVRFERRSKTRNRSWIFVDGSVRANFLLEKMRSLSSSGRESTKLPLGLAQSFQTAIDRFQFTRCLGKVAESCQTPICRKSASIRVRNRDLS